MSAATATESASKKFVWEVREERYADLVARFDKFTRRARKCRAAPPRFTVIHETIQEIGDEPDKEIVRFLYVVVEGEKPRLPGWTFLATIDHEDGENIIKSVPGSPNLPLEFRKALPVCHHCGTVRRRNATYVLRNDDGGFKQVGRNCLADFLGDGDLTSAVSSLEWWTEAVEMAEQSESTGGGTCGGREYPLLWTDDVLARTQLAVEKFGWTSKAKSNYQTPATAALVAASFFLPVKNERDEITFLRTTRPTPDQIAKAAKALEWARSIDEAVDNDYLYNLRTVARGEAIRSNRLGLLCSIPAAFDRDTEMKSVASAPSISGHVGTIGKRETFAGCTLTRIGLPIESYMGGVNILLTFTDPNGNTIKWFKSGHNQVLNYTDDGEAVMEWQEGKTYNLAATPKAHSEYKGKKETLVNRVVVAVEKQKKSRAKSK